MTDKCTYCDKPVPDGEGIYLDENGADGVFVTTMSALRRSFWRWSKRSIMRDESA